MQLETTPVLSINIPGLKVPIQSSGGTPLEPVSRFSLLVKIKILKETLFASVLYFFLFYLGTVAPSVQENCFSGGCGKKTKQLFKYIQQNNCFLRYNVFILFLNVGMEGACLASSSSCLWSR